MQSLNLEEHKVPHLKDLIHICLEPEAQGLGMTFTCVLLAQITPISYHTEENGCILFPTGVYIRLTDIKLSIKIYICTFIDLLRIHADMVPDFYLNYNFSRVAIRWTMRS